MHSLTAIALKPISIDEAYCLLRRDIDVIEASVVADHIRAELLEKVSRLS